MLGGSLRELGGSPGSSGRALGALGEPGELWGSLRALGEPQGLPGEPGQLRSANVSGFREYYSLRVMGAEAHRTATPRRGAAQGCIFASFMVSTNQNRLVLMSLIDSDNDTRWVGRCATRRLGI